MSEVEIYNQLDSDLKTVKSLKWLPFVGDRYLDDIPKENRMLIVGESHYNDGTEKGKLNVDDIGWTRVMIQGNAIEEESWPTKIIPNFHKAMFGEGEFGKDKFWNSVSFYNFIQRSMNTISDRPSPDEFNKDWSTFFDLIKILKPKTCLFIGVSSSDHLMSAILDSEFSCEGMVKGDSINGTYSRTATLKDNKNNEIKLIFMKHSSQYFSWTDWNEYLEEEIKSQLSWFKNNIDFKPSENQNPLNVEMKRKLIDVRESIKDEIGGKSEVIQIEFQGPATSGKYSDCFICKFIVNDVELVYEVAIDDCDFGLYCYTVDRSYKEKLEENGIVWFSLENEKSSEEIASRITYEIIKIISILKDETIAE